jgi:acetyl-CoA carboxylase biotin carboxyl carrier protein
VDLTKLKELMNLLETSDLQKLTIKEKGGLEIHLEKPPKEASVQPQAISMPVAPVPSVIAPPAQNKAEEKPGDYITSPMVGTYYGSPSPEDPPFVKSGDRVEADSVVCIIEAMKVMNEVKAGKAGVVREVLIDNSNPVEFGTKLIRIE